MTLVPIVIGTLLLLGGAAGCGGSSRSTSQQDAGTSSADGDAAKGSVIDGSVHPWDQGQPPVIADAKVPLSDSSILPPDSSIIRPDSAVPQPDLPTILPHDLGASDAFDGGVADLGFECAFPETEPNCYFEHDFTGLILRGSPAREHHLLVGFDYNIRPTRETDSINALIRADDDYDQFNVDLTGSAGRFCGEVYVYRESTSAPLYLQGFSAGPPMDYEAGPFTVEVPPPSPIPPICETASSALETFQLAMADPFFLHAADIMLDATGNRLILPETGAYSGAFFKEGTITMADLDEFRDAVGVQPAIIVTFTDYVRGFPRESVDNILAFGSIPLVKVMPMDWNFPDLDAFPMEETLTGAHNEIIDEYLNEVALTPGPVLFAWAHEVNLPGVFPYCREAAIAAATHRYVLNRAQDRGIANLNAINNLNAWPFEDFKDYIFEHPLLVSTALDGYNFGVQSPPCWSDAWYTFDDIFKRPYLEAACYFPEMPLMIGEFATASAGGDRATWYCDAYTKIKQYPINGFVIFSFSKNEPGCGFIDWDIRG